MDRRSYLAFKLCFAPEYRIAERARRMHDISYVLSSIEKPDALSIIPYTIPYLAQLTAVKQSQVKFKDGPRSIRSEGSHN
jgi:hypothetical protein